MEKLVLETLLRGSLPLAKSCSPNISNSAFESGTYFSSIYLFRFIFSWRARNLNRDFSITLLLTEIYIVLIILTIFSKVQSDS